MKQQVTHSRGSNSWSKSIDNWFGNRKDKTWDDFSTEAISILKKGFKANELRYNPKFVKVCKSINRSPKYQYQLMQIVLQLDPDVLIEAKKELHHGLAY